MLTCTLSLLAQNLKTHPRPSSPHPRPAPSPPPALRARPTAWPSAPPQPRKRAPPLLSSLVADSMGPHVSVLSFFIPGESKPVTNSKPNPIPGIRDFLA